MSFLHFLNENVLFFDKENRFSFQISPTFNKLKKKKSEFETMEKEEVSE